VFFRCLQPPTPMEEASKVATKGKEQQSKVAREQQEDQQ
jgi:hypothetical protein